MDAVLPRIHAFEIDDQPWFPNFLRSRIQATLTGFWTVRMPFVQNTVPCVQAARVFLDAFGSSISQYAVVDFCSGAGGPIPAIEQAMNRRLASEGKAPVQFVLTDIAPHLAAWKKAAHGSKNVHFVPTSINAAAAPSPPNLLAQAGLSSSKKLLRTFHLSFHHFDDDAAALILRNTFQTADAVAIVELVERTFSSVMLNFLLALPMFIMPPFLFWNDPTMLLFTYVLPIIPAVTVFDGIVSALRGRREDELLLLVKRAQVNHELTEWEWTWGREMHTWPIGYMTYFIGKKKEKR